ncbi:MAG: SDR family NAD(P)-dependent oxidoreductase [Alphaproteobacteria bacterium]|nr:SDR family NAD(P)-dependent oxidoreductase [Alphaproteobacteria bacterium]
MSDISLEGKVALITGGGRGMGREMATAFAQAGATGVGVMAAPGSDERAADIQAEIDGVVAEIEGAGGKAIGILADVSQWEDCRRAVEETVAAFGGLHILVNNAGKSGRYVGTGGERRIPFFEADPAGYCEVMATNVNGPFLMARAAAAHLMQAGWGRIINISKNVDAMHRALNSPYGPSKAALDAATLVWAEDLIDTKVTVNSLGPGGSVNTKFGSGEIRGVGMDPTVIVPPALWLASEDSDGVTGCRYIANRWDPGLPAAEAAEGCREPAIFPAPERETPLTRAWS